MQHEAKIEAIWLKYHQNLKAFLISRIQNPNDAEDILQDVMAKAYQHAGALKKADSLKAWLFQVANNSVTDFYRKHKRTQNLKSEDLWYASEKDQQPHVFEQCVAPFLNGLPSEQQHLLQAVDIEDRSQKELAKELGIPYSTLKSRVSKAREDLRSLFENCCRLQFDPMGKVVDYSVRSKKCTDC